ncbi:hypothetical protein BVG81_003585 [Haliangium sp. UPWRP_2]|nr:hypothetical protein BVG81_003585 [Haliangium sp. UPWRP_2]
MWVKGADAGEKWPVVGADSRPLLAAGPPQRQRAVVILYAMRSLMLWLCVLLMAAPRSVLAHSPHAILDSSALIAGELARQHFENGIRLFENGLFEAARVEFEASFKHSGEPDMLWNLSVTAERLGQHGDALDFALRFQDAKGSKLNAAESDETQKRINRLRELAAIPAKRAHRNRAIAISLITFGGLAIVGAVGCGVGALSVKQKLESGSFFQSEYNAIVGSGQALNGATIGLGIVGALSVGGGVALLLLGGQSQKRLARVDGMGLARDP